MEQYNGTENRRKRFFPSVSLGSIIATCAFVMSGIGIYTQLYADVKNNTIEIVNVKADALKKDQQDRDARQEIRQDLRDVKQDVKGLNDKFDKVIYELRQQQQRR